MSNATEASHKQIQTQIVDFFAYFSDFYTKYKKLLKPIQDEALKVHRLSERLKTIQQANIIKTPLETIPNIKSYLIYAVCNDINTSMKAMKKHAKDFYKICDTIKKKESELQANSLVIDFNSKCTLVNGSVHQPRLPDLLDYAQEVVSSVCLLCFQINNFVTNITLDDKNDESLLYSAFKFDKCNLRKLDEIFAMTLHCKKNYV